MLPNYRPFYFVNNPEAFRLFKSALSAITDIKNKIVNCLTTDDIEQTTGSNEAAVMSQAVITSELNKKLNIAQGAENEDKVLIVNSSGNLELTDAPSPVAMHNYSTTEQVIGTWIDGKPLYEITLVFNKGNIQVDGKQDHNIENIDTIINTTGVLIVDRYSLLNEKSFIPFEQNNAGDMEYWAIFGITKFHSKIGTGYRSSDYIASYTIQYTKSTDTAPVSEEE